MIGNYQTLDTSDWAPIIKRLCVEISCALPMYDLELERNTERKAERKTERSTERQAQGRYEWEGNYTSHYRSQIVGFRRNELLNKFCDLMIKKSKVNLVEVKVDGELVLMSGVKNSRCSTHCIVYVS